jgi:phosphatidylserine decarboxylase
MSVQQELTLVPGYSPHSRGQIDSWLLDIHDEILGLPTTSVGYGAPVRDLAALLSRDAMLRMYVLQMIEQVGAEHATVASTPELLNALELISTRAPEYCDDPARANFFPVSTLFVYMMMTPAGQVVFRHTEFNDCLRAILRDWCRFLDSPKSCSVLHTGERGWLSPSSYQRHNLDQYEIPDRTQSHWGFPSFNAFFHRRVRPECRPIADPADPKRIVSPNDGTLYKVTRDVKSTDQFWIKSQPYSINNMLHGHPWSERFYGGTVFQSFLDGRNYHRFHAPVSGTVRDLRVIDGLMFSNAESAGFDLTAGTYSQAYMSCVNTRGLVFIESDDPALGLVCLIAVGISEISSVSFSVRANQHLGKGDELGYFSYGGSSVCLLFQPGAIRSFHIDEGATGTQVGTRGAPIAFGQLIAEAR